MKSPFLIALAAGGISLLVALVPVAWHMLSPASRSDAPPREGTPWQVAQPAPGASEVFGLALPGSTLAQVRARWGEDLRVALIAERAGPDARVALEAYLEQFNAGGVTGRLVLAFDADPAMLARWRAGGPGTPTESGARRHALDAATLAEAGAVPLAGLSFVPSAQLDADALRARFGEPAERIADGERVEHWLYPALGLAVLLDRQGRELLQYVAPADFERRLAAPLRRE